MDLMACVKVNSARSISGSMDKVSTLRVRQVSRAKTQKKFTPLTTQHTDTARTSTSPATTQSLPLATAPTACQQ